MSRRRSWFVRAVRCVAFFTWVGWLVSRLVRLWPFSMIASALERLERSTGRWPVAALVGMALVLGAVLRELDALLRAMHPDGGSAYGAQRLIRTFHLPDPGYTRDVLATWDALGEALVRSSTWVFAQYIVVDTLFAVVYTALLGVLLIKLGNALAQEDPRFEEGAERRVAKRAPIATRELIAAERSGVEARRVAYWRLSVFAFQAVPLLFLVDLAENAVASGLVFWTPTGSTFDVLAWALGVLGHVKLLLVVLIVVPGVVAALWLRGLREPTLRSTLRTLVVLRGQILIVVLLAAALFVSDQSRDALRLWRDDVFDGISAAALVLLLALLMFALTVRLLEAASRARRPAPGSASLVWAALVLAGLGAILYFRWGLGSGLWVAAVLVLGTGVLSRAVGTLQPEAEGVRSDISASALAGALAAAGPLLLGLAVIGAATPALAYDETSARGLTSAVLLFVTGIALVVASGVIYARRKQLAKSTQAQSWFVGIGFAAAVLIALRVYLNPWRTSEVLGSIGVFLGFLLVASFVVYWLVKASESRVPPSVFTLLRFRRVPVFLLLLVWAVSISMLDRDGIYADARVLDATPEVEALHRAPPQATTVFTTWAKQQAGGEQAVPMLFVSAAGGGIRAAYWTAVVLRCVLEGDSTDTECAAGGEEADKRAAASFFAASGISGGSLGLGAYAAHLELGPDDDPSWAEDRLDYDAVAPVIAWGLFTDLPMALLRRNGGTDRAEILERSWERAWLTNRTDRSLVDVFASRSQSTKDSIFAGPYLRRWAVPSTQFPVLMLNGTKVQDGCRINVSVISGAVRSRTARTKREKRLVEDCLALRLFERGSESTASLYVPPSLRASWSLATSDDLYDLICIDEDVRLSTAVLLSARFPWVMPSGRLHCERENKKPVNVVDGGYFDTSGASPLVELSSALAPQLARVTSTCIVPVFLQIDTGYADPVQASDQAPLETSVPPTAVRRARDAREHNARQAAALEFSGPFGAGVRAFVGEGPTELDRFAHIYPRAHPGARAPLGWSLSGTAIKELKSQLSFNAGEIEKVRSWFAGNLTCREVPAVQAAETAGG